MTMQFIKHGPDIPEALLQAHEEGRVVFFCGAGISYPAGLPGFQGLVDQIYDALGTVRTDIEEQAYSRGQYDATLDLLERRIPGQRIAVRTALAKVLKPKLRHKGATDTHASLLQLARSRDGAVRLVTTNFDRIFQILTARAKPAIPTYPAPLLPIPKNSRWDGVVYLHGVLPETPDENALHRLVLTSGDFGLAYLTERWAARFVSELFRNYIVCFVGYSINDPVLRYMMDALAADRMLGEVTSPAYALGDFQSGQEADKHIEWEAKGVTPILYEVPTGTHDHSVLHRTLQVWAENYRDGVQGKERIVLEYAMTRPLASTKQDDYVGRMIWALSHESGLPARRFSEFDPAPSLDWLEPLSEDRFRQSDLPRFGVPPRSQLDEKLVFSLLRRPAPYTHAPRMTLVASDAGGSQWDDVIFQFARWLTRHLNDPALVLWLAKRGGALHERFAWMIEQRLDVLARLEREGKAAELERIRSMASNAIPHPLMRTVWRLLLTGRIRTPWLSLDLFRWRRHLAREGFTTMLRLELRELLAPKILLRQPFRWGEKSASGDTPKRLKDLVGWELVLASNNVHSSLRDLTNAAAWQAALPALLDDFQQLLRDALDLLRELGEADDKSDPAHWNIPSISPHWQNRGFRDWVALIEFLRDSWIVTLHNDPERAQRIAQNWFTLPYPTFKRLALFAATHEGVTSAGDWVDWLLIDNGWWLWSLETRRETMRLLVLQGARLSGTARARLETGILAGPPRRMFRDDIEPNRWQDLVDHSVWLRLSKLASGGSTLGEDATAKLAELSLAHLAWKLATDESDEFSHWMSGTGDPDYESRREIERAPRKRRELVIWLQRPLSKHPFHEDDWSELCREKFSLAACALCALANENHWPAEHWREALQTWSEGRLVRRSWRYVAPLLQRMPDNVLLTIADSASWWLETASKVFDRHREVFLDLCRRFLMMTQEGGVDEDRPVSGAINQRVANVTQALLNAWFQRQPNDDQGLPDDLKPVFTALCDTQIEQYRHARGLLAANVIALFRVDREWATACLLPLFNWRLSPDEARAAWEGFLWSPRLYRPLLTAFRADFLETARHYADLGEHGRQYAAILTYAALDPADTFTPAELYKSTSALPQDGLQEAAQALVNAVEGAGEQREQYWDNRIQPYWQTIWPKSRQFASNNMAEQLARLAISARGAFPSALRTIGDWLQPLESPDFVVHLLHESGLCSRFPQDALRLLDGIIADQPWAPTEIGDCLTAVVTAWPDAHRDGRYKRLMEYARQHGQQ
jgi:hypothetical protein